MTMDAQPEIPKRNFRIRLSASVPSLTQWTLGALAWGAAMASSCLLSITILRWTPYAHERQLLLLFFVGGVLAWLIALPLVRFFSLGRPAETRLAAALLFLSAGTVGMTAYLFAVQYRAFYAQWHAPFGTKIWAYQYAYTTASAFYQFAILGLRFYFPLGLLLVVAASILLARRSR